VVVADDAATPFSGRGHPFPGAPPAMDRLLPVGMSLLERNTLPDALTRAGIRQLLAVRLAEEASPTVEGDADRHAAMVASLRESPVAIETAAANEQHYELPATFFRAVLGPRLKYSCAYFPRLGASTLAEAEDAMLALYVERAGLVDGMRVADVGCGWGSLCLYIAEHFPACTITAVSNSTSQRVHIEGVAKRRGFTNLTVVTADVSTWAGPPVPVDVLFSIEMLEHMKNYGALFAKFGSWTTDAGVAFIHIFLHKAYAYHFETEGASNWMGRHFFSGGTMPSAALLHYFAGDGGWTCDRYWAVDGRHYAATSEAWLARMDAAGPAVRAEMVTSYGAAGAVKWTAYWRTFFLAVAELFAYKGGSEWYVGHYRWTKRRAGAAPAAAT